MTLAPARWLAIRCRSASCDVPGGRVIYRERVGGQLSIKRRGTGVIMIGVPILLLCRCGWIWRNTDIAATMDSADGLCDDGDGG